MENCEPSESSSRVWTFERTYLKSALCKVFWGKFVEFSLLKIFPCCKWCLLHYKLSSGYCANWQKSDQHPNDQLNDEMSIQAGSHPNLRYMFLNIHIRSSKFKGNERKMWATAETLYILLASYCNVWMVFSTLTICM